MSCCDAFQAGSTGVEITLRLRDCNQDPVDLTGVVEPIAVSFRLGSAAAVSRTLTIVDAALGEVRYTTQAGDFATAGSWKGQATVTWPAGKVIKSEVFVVKVLGNL